MQASSGVVASKHWIRAWANLDDTRIYRYALGRVLAPEDGRERRALVVVGLNPSTADEDVDDPTIIRCIGFAKRWDYTDLVMVNLFAFRATNPKELKRQPLGFDVVGPDNDAVIMQLASRRRDTHVLVAWGSGGTLKGRNKEVLAIVRRNIFAPYCLGETKNGQPKHPLYIPADFEPYAYIKH